MEPTPVKLEEPERMKVEETGEAGEVKGVKFPTFMKNRSTYLTYMDIFERVCNEAIEKGYSMRMMRI